MNKMKRIALTLGFIAIAAAIGWYFMSTSNTWNALTIGDIPAPSGFTRVEAPKGSYAHYLRSLPLKERGAKVQLYTGGNARLQILSTAVIDQNIMSNSEQCADATMRLSMEPEPIWRNSLLQREWATHAVLGRQFTQGFRGVYAKCVWALQHLFALP